MRSILLLSIVALILCGCYQVRSDDLSTVPVTNNPSIVPRHASMSQFTAMQP